MASKAAREPSGASTRGTGSGSTKWASVVGCCAEGGRAEAGAGAEADAGSEPQVVGLGDGKAGVDGVHGRDRGEERGLALAHQVPPVHLDPPDDAVDGGLNRRVAQIQLRLADGGLRGLHRGLGDLDLGPLNELAVPEGGVGGLDVGHGHLLLGQRGVQVLLGDRPGLPSSMAADGTPRRRASGQPGGARRPLAGPGGDGNASLVSRFPVRPESPCARRHLSALSTPMALAADSE